MKVFFTLLFVWLLGSTALWGQPADVVWNSQSRNSSGSMPCGGGDITGFVPKQIQSKITDRLYRPANNIYLEQ